MIRTLWIFCLLATLKVASNSLEASDGASLFSTANEAYEQGKFQQAASIYEQAITNGASTATAWFNLGNARFKSGELGRAIAAWRMAELSTPRDSALRANLAFARGKAAGNVDEPTPVSDRLTRYFTANEWIAAAAITWWIFFIVLAFAIRRRPSTRTRPGMILILLGGACVLLIAAAVKSFFETYHRTRAVVTRQAAARFGPLEDSQISFQVTDGLEFVVTDSTDGWVQVQSTTGKVGWIKKGDVVIVSLSAKL